MKRNILAAAVLAAGTVIPIALADAGSASAASFKVGNYPAFPRKGTYPGGNHACGGSGWTTAAGPKTYKNFGHTYSLRLCFKPRVGAYARLDGAAINDTHCEIALDRSNQPNETTNYATVYETVDSNVGYAYTKIGSDLNDRFARAALVCNLSGTWTAVVRTGWFASATKPTTPPTTLPPPTREKCPPICA